jgi:hypothetical protein
MATNTIGRPTVLTEDCLLKLREGFLKGYNNGLACVHADISERAFYEYCAANEEFAQLKEQWKKAPVLKAINIINDSLDAGDVNTAKYVAERRCREDWAVTSKQDITVTGGIAVQIETVPANEENIKIYEQDMAKLPKI